MPPHVGGSLLIVQAICFPSGENRGDVSAAFVLRIGLTVPSATLINERSADGQSSGRGELVCAAAIVVPSGDQSYPDRPARASLTMLSVPAVNCRDNNGRCVGPVKFTT